MDFMALGRGVSFFTAPPKFCRSKSVSTVPENPGFIAGTYAIAADGLTASIDG